jgi:hypothetical protein
MAGSAPDLKQPAGESERKPGFFDGLECAAAPQSFRIGIAALLGWWLLTP